MMEQIGLLSLCGKQLIHLYSLLSIMGTMTAEHAESYVITKSTTTEELNHMGRLGL